MSIEPDITVRVPECPGPRKREHGDNSGEEFLHDVLIPALEKHRTVRVDLTPAIGIPASWSEEVFGGVVRELGVAAGNRIWLLGLADPLFRASAFMTNAKRKE